MMATTALATSPIAVTQSGAVSVVSPISAALELQQATWMADTPFAVRQSGDARDGLRQCENSFSDSLCRASIPGVSTF